MTVWLVRHGCAGPPEEWAGPDETRPLDDAGLRQAAAIAELLGRERPVRLLTGPAERCVATLRPLSALAGIPILKTPALGRSAEVAPIIELVTKQPGRSVLCTHGEAMEPLLTLFRAIGMRLSGAASDEEWLRLGVAWRVDREAMAIECRAPREALDCERHAALAGSIA